MSAHKANYYFPLNFFTGLIFFTLIVFAFGPWPWPSRDSLTFYIFMAFVIMAMQFGYRRGVRGGAREYRGKYSSIRLYRIGVLLTLLLFIPTLLWRAGGAKISLDLLLDPALAYSMSHDPTNFSGTAWIEYLRIIFAVYLYLTLPLLIVLWSRLSPTWKCIGVLAVFLEAFLWIVVGTNKGIGDILVGVFWMVALRYRGVFTLPILWKFGRVVLPIFLFFAIFFTVGQLGRSDGAEVKSTLHSLKVEVDRDGIFIKHLPIFIREGVIAFSFYLTQGYQGLCLSFDEPFIPTWGVGHSRFLTSYADKYLGTDIENSTYPARVEISTGLDSKVYWHTMFPWFASDVTFPGTIVLIYLFSYLFAMAWKDSLEYKNPYAISIFLQIAVLFTYMSANNQVFQSGSGFVGFWVTLVFWVTTRGRLIQPRR